MPKYPHHRHSSHPFPLPLAVCDLGQDRVHPRTLRTHVRTGSHLPAADAQLHARRPAGGVQLWLHESRDPRVPGYHQEVTEEGDNSSRASRVFDGDCTLGSNLNIRAFDTNQCHVIPSDPPTTNHPPLFPLIHIQNHEHHVRRGGGKGGSRGKQPHVSHAVRYEASHAAVAKPEYGG